MVSPKAIACVCLEPLWLDTCTFEETTEPLEFWNNWKNSSWKPKGCKLKTYSCSACHSHHTIKSTYLFKSQLPRINLLFKSAPLPLIWREGFNDAAAFLWLHPQLDSIGMLDTRVVLFGRFHKSFHGGRHWTICRLASWLFTFRLFNLFALGWLDLGFQSWLHNCGCLGILVRHLRNLLLGLQLQLEPLGSQLLSLLHRLGQLIGGLTHFKGEPLKGRGARGNSNSIPPTFRNFGDVILSPCQPNSCLLFTFVGKELNEWACGSLGLAGRRRVQNLPHHKCFVMVSCHLMAWEWNH